jgi:NADH-quinone oxidoreductase subunit B
MRAWARRRSLWVLPFGTTCCAADLAAAFAPGCDLNRFGASWVHDASLADVLVVAGRITRAIAPVLLRTYDDMPLPRRVIAFGTCACSGGAFDTDEVVGGADEVIPVDAYVPGCPPEPDALHDALARLDPAHAGT